MFSMPRNFDTALWCNFLRYLSVSCPNLRLLEVDLLLDFMDISRKLAIETTVRALRDEIFPTLASTMAVDFLHLNEMNVGMVYPSNGLFANPCRFRSCSRVTIPCCGLANVIATAYCSR